MTTLTIFLSAIIIIQIVLFISLINHLKMVLKCLYYMCDTMTLDYEEGYKEVC